MTEILQNTVSGKFLMFRGKPLLREGNQICYGDMEEKAILILEIMSYRDEGGTKVPKDVFIQVIDPKDQTKIIKQGKKEGLSEAFSVGLVWLDLALKANA
jgi:hypothetical protein